MKRREKDQELADRAYLLRAWRRHHREQLQEALARVHRDVLEHLMEQLKDLRSARELVNFIAAQNWELADADARAVALHEINAAICRLREKHGPPPIHDGLPGEPDMPYRAIRAIVLTPSPHHEGAHRGEARPE